ncbi:MAG: helix-turn-helix domain-containing protein [Planctomycetia bacterium]|nr:helix-turn-helix domain-containing protein [Planctomycetia bacterium]
MPAGRKPMGIEQVDLLLGSEAARRRLAVLLANVAGELSVDEACQELGLHRSRFFELRKQWLQGSVEALEPEPAGRPVGASSESLPPETGGDGEKRPPRIAYNASGEVGPTPDTSGNGVSVGSVGALGRIAELEDLVAQTRWELRTSQLREELAALGLSRPKRARPAQKKTGLAARPAHRERGGAR